MWSHDLDSGACSYMVTGAPPTRVPGGEPVPLQLRVVVLSLLYMDVHVSLCAHTCTHANCSGAWRACSRLYTCMCKLICKGASVTVHVVDNAWLHSLLELFRLNLFIVTFLKVSHYIFQGDVIILAAGEVVHMCKFHIGCFDGGGSVSVIVRMWKSREGLRVCPRASLSPLGKSLESQPFSEIAWALCTMWQF